MSLEKHKLFAATSVIALLAAGPAFARDLYMFSADHTGGNSNINMERAASNTGAYMQSASEIRAEKLVGRKLTDAQGNLVGETQSVIIGHGGKVAALIVGVGGHIGLRGHNISIAWKDIRVSNGGKTIRTDLTKAQLKGLPEYRYRQTANAAMSYTHRRYPKSGNDKDLRKVGGSTY